MYEINNLTFRYMLSDRNSLKQVSLRIKKGKITLIAGPSGSGKTTLLRHLKKELLPRGKKSGKVLYDGQEIEQLKDLQSVKEVGYLFQNPSAQMVMDTVWHEIAFGLENLGMPYEQMKRTVAEIVNYFDLQKIYHEDTDQLSGGQKQLVNLAAVMAMHPKVLILDEPINGLDPSGIVEFRQLLKRLNEEKKITILLSSHILTELQQLATVYGFLSKGRLLEQITAETLHERCTDSVEITVSDVQQYAVFLEEQLSGEGYKVLSDGKIRIVNPKQDIEVYSRLAAEHGIFIRELTRKQASLEAYYMNLKKGGNQGC